MAKRKKPKLSDIKDRADSAPEATAKPEERKRPPAAADVLTALATCNATLFHDAGQVAYATFGAKTAKIRGRAFKLWLSGLYHDATDKAANAEAVSAALATLEAHAIFQSPEMPVYVRLAQHDGRVYLHLADDAGTVIEIGAEGWRVCSAPPVRFLATANSSPLPMPVRGGQLAELRSFINCPDDDSFALVAGWIAACYRFDGPFPLLVLTGQQGSAKSTTARVLKLLIDPGKVKDRSTPKEPRDLAIWAAGSWLLCCDNLSSFPDWLSDSFCRLATGGGFGTRTLYENDEETVFDAKRPVILNGIEDFVTRGDLLERSIVLRHPAIPDNQRRLESELWAAFDKARPRLLGAVLDRVAAGLKTWPKIDKRLMPRMADAGAFAVACEQGMGEPARFLEAFRQNQNESHEQVLADSLIVPQLLGLIDQRIEWQGTPTELFAVIKPAGDKLPQGWPKKPSSLSGQLRRIAPSLLKVHGVRVASDRLSDAKRTRVISVSRGENSVKVPSGASDVVRNPATRTTADGPDGGSDKFSSDLDLSALFH